MGILMMEGIKGVIKFSTENIRIVYYLSPVGM